MTRSLQWNALSIFCCDYYWLGWFAQFYPSRECVCVPALLYCGLLHTLAELVVFWSTHLCELSTHRAPHTSSFLLAVILRRTHTIIVHRHANATVPKTHVAELKLGSLRLVVNFLSFCTVVCLRFSSILAILSGFLFRVVVVVPFLSLLSLYNFRWLPNVKNRINFLKMEGKIAFTRSELNKSNLIITYRNRDHECE